MFKFLPRLASLTIDSSRSLAEAALVALEHLACLTSLDLMRCNPDCRLFYPTATEAAPPPTSQYKALDSTTRDLRGAMQSCASIVALLTRNPAGFQKSMPMFQIMAIINSVIR